MPKNPTLSTDLQLLIDTNVKLNATDPMKVDCTMPGVDAKTPGTTVYYKGVAPSFLVFKFKTDPKYAAAVTKVDAALGREFASDGGDILLYIHLFILKIVVVGG